MRNAEKTDIEEFHKTGILREDVMYSVTGFSLRAHGKPYSAVMGTYIKAGEIFVEWENGVLSVVPRAHITSIVRKGPAQREKTPKRKPTKGTRPERKIPFLEYLKTRGEPKSGDVVITASKKRLALKAFSEVFDTWFVVGKDYAVPHNGEQGEVLGIDIPNAHFFFMEALPVDKFRAKSCVKRVIEETL